MTTATKKKVKKPDFENVRVSSSTLEDVRKYCDEAGIKIGWFYDQAAKEKLEKSKQ